MQNKYTTYIFIKITIILFLSLESFSQSITMPDSLLVFKSSQGDLLFEYKVDKGNTVYSISRFFKVDIMQVYGYNPQLQSKPLEVNSKIVVPFNLDLLSSENADSQNKVIKVFYRVGLKENLFRIARIYFKRPIDELVRLNHLHNNIINPGQMLYIGNIFPDAITSKDENKKQELSDNKNKQEQEKIVEVEEDQSGYEKEKPVFVRKIVIKDDEEEAKEEKEENGNVVIDSSEVADSTSVGIVKSNVIEDNGLAIWNKKLNVNGIFVLHNDAKLYTLMELYNPLVNKTIVAKVIGRIPDNTYPDNVKVILSPEAAKSLRALDQRFFVRYKYLK